MAAVPHPPYPLPVFNPTAALLLTDAEHIIYNTRERHALLLSKYAGPASANFNNAIVPFAQAENDFITESRQLIFYEDVSPDASVRDASARAKERFAAFKIETSTNDALFQLVDAVYQNEPERTQLDEESQRFLEKIRHEHIVNGLSLSAGLERERFKRIKIRLSQIESEFNKNLALAKSGDSGVWFSREDLEGVPDDVLSRLECGARDTCNEEALLVGFSNTVVFCILKCAVKSATRKRFYLAYENMVPGNVVLLKEAACLRDEAARLIGYPNHAAFSLQSKMARSPETVNKFLGQLKEALADGAKNEINRLKQLKQQNLKARGEENDGRFYLWDNSFYNNLSLKQEHAIDQQALSEYFLLEIIVPGMLNVFENVLGFHFFEMSDEDKKGKLWHEDVQVYSVWDAKDMGGGFIGYLYLDLYPREGKIDDARSVNLIPGVSGNSQQPAATLLICSIPKSTTEQPSLLQHHQVVLLFHELGHCIHDLASRTRYARLYGPDGAAVDFSEAPSQLLEFWFWTSSVLQAIPRHYSYYSPQHFETWKRRSGGDSIQPPETMPAKMIERFVDSKTANQALVTLTQVAIGMFDMAVHSTSLQNLVDLNLPALYNRIRKDVRHLDDLSDLGGGYEWGHGFAIYPHLIGGYAAGFYAYLFSRAYAADLFYSKFEVDPMNAEEGRKYRREILEKGSIRDELDMLVQYLGREPSLDAFYRELGLAKEPA
ncbi:Saccharolysin [Cytospora mali]|uniref:Saccharolysin n=1 Tax=Cytospora mali TaxID=578113 RepID=A0A194VAW1_CYTMA|nr:Saccharolysin [Valsa mali var. pyri (nom. inval.)]